MDRVVSENDRRINGYAELHSSQEPDYLYELRRMTHQRTLAPQMLSGHLQGRLLSMISKMIQPSLIVEVGTFTGYATLCLAEGLAADGRLITMEANPELAYISNAFFDRSPYAHQIEPRVGDARQLIGQLPDAVDVAWIDAGKRDYQLYYDALIDKVRPGGVIMADNVLWDGKVASDSSDDVTQSLQAFNTFVAKDKRVEQVILPMRDGITIVRKK